jgi:hypothetical protein
MSVFKEVLGQPRAVVPLFEISKMFLKFSFEKSPVYAVYFILQLGRLAPIYHSYHTYFGQFHASLLGVFQLCSQ